MGGLPQLQTVTAGSRARLSESTTPATAGLGLLSAPSLTPSLAGYTYPWHAAAGAGGTLLLVAVTACCFVGSCAELAACRVLGKIWALQNGSFSRKAEDAGGLVRGCGSTHQGHKQSSSLLARRVV